VDVSAILDIHSPPTFPKYLDSLDAYGLQNCKTVPLFGPNGDTSCLLIEVTQIKLGFVESKLTVNADYGNTRKSLFQLSYMKRNLILLKELH